MRLSATSTLLILIKESNSLYKNRVQFTLNTQPSVWMRPMHILRGGCVTFCQQKPMRAKSIGSHTALRLFFKSKTRQLRHKRWHRVVPTLSSPSIHRYTSLFATNIYTYLKVSGKAVLNPRNESRCSDSSSCLTEKGLCSKRSSKCAWNRYTWKIGSSTWPTRMSTLKSSLNSTKAEMS